jgi:hypothetical protein
MAPKDMRCVGRYGIFGFDRRNGSFVCRRLTAPERPRQKLCPGKTAPALGDVEAESWEACANRHDPIIPGPGRPFRFSECSILNIRNGTFLRVPRESVWFMLEVCDDQE